MEESAHQKPQVAFSSLDVYEVVVLRHSKCEKAGIFRNEDDGVAW